MEQNPLLEMRTLAVGYAGTRHHYNCVAHGLTASLHASTVVALAGANGTGKSTLLRTLAGLQRPLSGVAAWRGQPTANLTARELARTVSVVLTGQPSGARALTAREVVELGRTPHTGFDGRLTATDKQAVEEAMAQTGTTVLADRPLQYLSDGERQRVMIAKALAQDTPAILLDEPTAFLDFPGKVEVLRLLARLAREQGKAVLFSTHDLELAFRMADRLWLLSADGLAEGTPQQLADTGIISRFFCTRGVAFDAATLRFVLTSVKEEEQGTNGQLTMRKTPYDSLHS